MGFSPSEKERKIGVVDDEVEAALDSIISSDLSEIFSVESSESDLMEDEVTSYFSSSSSTPSCSSSSASIFSGEIAITSPLHDMSSLLHQLPIKRGLSKYFQGKSQSFTSLINVRSLEDLPKPENPYNKKLKSWKSYGGLLSYQQSHTPSNNLQRAHSSSRVITKKQSNYGGICSPLSAKKTPSFIGIRPPISSPSPLPH